MRKFRWRVPCLCGFWLVISSCSGGVGGLRQLQPLTITSAVPPQAVMKQAYGGNGGFSVTATGGVPPYRWSWAADPASSLPPGLKLRSNPDGTGTILGIPAKTGPYGVIVTVTDSESPAVQKSETYIITVSASSPASQAATSGGPGPDLDIKLQDGRQTSAMVCPGEPACLFAGLALRLRASEIHL
jgi:hypothetical protein